MKVIYIADDGKEFSEEYECLDYEWKLNHPFLKDVLFYGKHNKKLDDVFSENTYNITEKVVVPNEEALKDFHEFAHYCGFCCYMDIDECGKWKFDYEKETFVKA